MSHEKVIIIIINTATKEVIIYRVLTTFRHGIKCFIGLLGKARRHGTVGESVDSGDTEPTESPSASVLPVTREATKQHLSTHR